jgi:hypothetical protein
MNLNRDIAAILLKVATSDLDAAQMDDVYDRVGGELAFLLGRASNEELENAAVRLLTPFGPPAPGYLDNR